ncbi:hypothetical protein Pmani_014601 [Petrolisthes manimaculis]|uniref:Endonuclease/exonuclease/phosphatase domain-containing protein n=1 Tax=Petrolisthes manimaculis TaxID=1843537 RepID=A0AAE1PD71_9EUCA|nr:hypothetical protein Pmani_022207 [Petrolisthes manimaculis]KAK4314112.1 hypothetical protein Pmani_014601 [Petrolisthes manimaculis]
MDTDDMIWVELSLCAGVCLGGVYVPPADSLYCEASPFQTLNEKCSAERGVIALGDLNARVGTPVMNCSDGCVYRYEGVRDNVVNSHGRMLLNTYVSSQMVVLNHLNHNKSKFGGDLSYRSGLNWISEIDLCIAKTDCINRVKHLEVNQTIRGSDHAPLCVSLATQGWNHVSPPVLMERARRLGESYHKHFEHIILRTPRYDTVNLNDFRNVLENLEPPSVDVPDQENVMNSISSGCEVLDRAARQCRKRGNQNENIWDVSQPRWKRILESNDLRMIWKAIDWSGKVYIHVS